MQFVKKITVATCGLRTSQLENICKGVKGGVPVLRIAGFIHSSKSEDKGSFGPYLVFSGEIAAVNMVDQEEYRSGKLILPPVAESAISPMVGNLEEGGRVKFGLDIMVEENNSDKGGTKFKYTVKPLVEPSEEDELSKMMKALPAPGAKPKARK